ncbi:hypothetical protein DNTS_014804 [Danionella cerebrum]|uniref:Serpin domain-containing protein n=1 Tax=Danionella cerebrum TaxID=2873325 RepID=A0A553QTU1_9TELE|nr:hypothetical protein DNTS_014804 [Danionella translucida]
MLLLLVLWPLVLLRACVCQAADAPEDVTAEFSVRLYHQLQQTGGEENIIFSPLSVFVALGMVELGARGSSLQEIREAVGYTRFRDDEEFSLLRNLTQTLSSDQEQYVVRLVNSLFLQTGAHFSDSFLTLMKMYFKAEVETVDFSETDTVAQHINSWVLNQTEGKIQQLVSAEDFISSTVIMLVNAVYFRGSWKNQFRPENTRTFSFTRDDGSEVQTLMIDGSSEAGGVYQVLEMLYEGEEMSMMLVLPRQEVPLASLEPIIKAPLLDEWANNVKKQKQLGITSIFNKKADLSGMMDQSEGVQGVYIGSAVQKACLEVTEEGAEGAAGSGSILFMGRVMTPEVIEPFDNNFDM